VENGIRPTRVLVDHSGYSLVNIGDIAMLQACVHRLRRRWPDAEIKVFTDAPERLAAICRGAKAVRSTVYGRSWSSKLSESSQLALEQVCRIALPVLDRRSGSARGDGSSPQGVLAAIRWADVVVSSGGGFLNDVFWWHGSGVLSTLRMAQRLKKPTAMFGQGVGPVSNPILRLQVRTTMRGLRVIGLREGVGSLPVLAEHAVEAARVSVTGDDALLLAVPATRPPTGSAVGLNVRVANYSHIAEDFGSLVVERVRASAERMGAPICALPIEHNKHVADLEAIAVLEERLVGTPVRGHELGDIATPAELADRVSRCRVVVTGSYHAAVFGLAVGVPAVCLSNSAYYDGKFNGLVDLFPGGCAIVRPGDRFDADLDAAIAWAAALDDTERDEIHRRARAQVRTADEVYDLFFDGVDAQGTTAQCAAPSEVAS
jgi:polysaccharide pyruvyl transferase WcaK-like protein